MANRDTGVQEMLDEFALGVGGRYLDKYEKRQGTWKFVDRMIVTDWAHVMDPSAVDLSHLITRGSPVDRGAPFLNLPAMHSR